MKVCIVGAGAIGGFIGTLLARAGCEVSALARGATLQALQTHGWRLHLGDELLSAPVKASADAAQLGPQDLLVIAVKAPALAELAPRLAPLIDERTLLLPAMNGVPWWFAASTPALADAPLRCVDADGRIAAALPLAQVLGCVVHASASTREPGWVQHHMGRGLIVGEPAGGDSPRSRALAQHLCSAGLEARVSAHIRKDTWYKLWGNLTMNPITAITGAASDGVLDDPLVRAFCSRCMAEASALGARIGCAIEQTPEDRHAVTRKLGPFRTSMQHDVAQGRAIELDAIVGAVAEIAARVGQPTPNIDALLGITRLFARQHGLYPAA